MRICDSRDLMTPAEVGAIIGWHEESVRRGLRTGRLRAGLKVGNRWYVRRDEFFATGGKDGGRGGEWMAGGEGVACHA